MDNRPILFLDSGIGGFPYCCDFLEKNRHESVFYLADHENYPYGPKEKEELKVILLTLLEKILEKLNPKIIVLACNTATISALSSLRISYPQILFVGTVPAVKPAAAACNNGRVGVLGTKRTIDEINDMNSMEQLCEIHGIAAPELVDFIEVHFFDSGKAEKRAEARKYIELFRKLKVDTLVLGCTHFLYMLEDFKSEAKNYFRIFDSLEGITKRIEFLLDENGNNLRTDEKTSPFYRFFLTGGNINVSVWEKLAESKGFNLTMFNEL